jgi:hypothetical protein
MAILNAEILPAGDSAFFSNWAGPDDLPSPDEVWSHSDVLHRHAATVVRFTHLNLIVKYGPTVRVAEGQALWVVENFTDVRAPTVYGWFQDGDEMFLYMSLVDGIKLDRRWAEMSEMEKLDVSRQLNCMLVSLHAVQSPRDETYIGSSPSFLLGSATLTAEPPRIPWTHSVSRWNILDIPSPFRSFFFIKGLS